MRLWVKLARNVEPMYEMGHSHLVDCSHPVSQDPIKFFGLAPPVSPKNTHLSSGSASKGDQPC